MADEPNQSGIDNLHADILDELVARRRSIRKYKPDPLPEAWIESILRCAHKAPSPSNSQPVVFVRIESRHHRNNLRRALADSHGRLIARHSKEKAPARLRNWINAYRRYTEFMFTAPVLLAIGVRHGVEGFASKLAEAGFRNDDGRQQCDLDITVGLALKGLLLKAQALGVGSCILTAPLVFIDHVEQLLGLEDISIRSFVTLGMADETPSLPPRKSLSEAVKVI